MPRFTRVFATILLAACIASGGAYAQNDADYAKRLEAAKVYAKTMDSRQMVGDMLAEMAKNPQVKMSADDVASMQAAIDFDKMNQVVLESMAKHFTEQELIDLGKFYSSPTGISVMKKMPSYMADVMPFIQQTVMTAVMKKLQERQQKATPPASLPSSKPQ